MAGAPQNTDVTVSFADSGSTHTLPVPRDGWGHVHPPLLPPPLADTEAFPNGAAAGVVTSAGAGSMPAHGFPLWPGALATVLVSPVTQLTTSPTTLWEQSPLANVSPWFVHQRATNTHTHLEYLDCGWF